MDFSLSKVSRSKKRLSKNEGEPKPKRQKMNQDIRDTRMKELEEIMVKESHSKSDESLQV